MTELDPLRPSMPEMLMSVAVILVLVALLAAVILLLFKLTRREKN